MCESLPLQKSNDRVDILIPKFIQALWLEQLDRRVLEFRILVKSTLKGHC